MVRDIIVSVKMEERLRSLEAKANEKLHELDLEDRENFISRRYAELASLRGIYKRIDVNWEKALTEKLVNAEYEKEILKQAKANLERQIEIINFNIEYDTKHD